MAETIVTRELIARQAEAAVLQWMKNRKAPRPPNPYDEHLEPAHHLEWQASFTRIVHAHDALPSSESSA